VLDTSGHPAILRIRQKHADTSPIAHTNDAELERELQPCQPQSNRKENTSVCPEVLQVEIAACESRTALEATCNLRRYLHFFVRYLGWARAAARHKMHA
jgi:hypothetical protein